MGKYADFDERRITLYENKAGIWEYAGGEGRDFSITAPLHALGSMGLFYNPNHIFLPDKIQLSQNYPNPFNPTTTIEFALPQESKVQLSVYNILGQRVVTLVNEPKRAGYHSVIWNGRSAYGRQVATGIYIYRMSTKLGVRTKKMMLIK